MKNKSIVGLVAIVAGLAFATTAAAATFTTPLKLGSTGEAVKALQMVLNTDPATLVSTTGAGSVGYESTYFGTKTKAAVIKFQAKYGIPQLGIVGPLTNAKLTEISGGAASTGGTTVIGCTSTTGFSPITGQSCVGNTMSTTTMSGPVSVSLSASQPMGGVITGQAGAVLANLTFTGSGTVNSVTLMRGGASDQSTLTNVYLYEGATRLTDGYTFNNTGVLAMNNLGLMVNGSRTIAIKGDVVNDGLKAGQTIMVSLTGITTASGAVTTNVAGPMLSVVNGSGLLATANFAAVPTPSSIATTTAGSMNQTLWSNSLSVGTRAVLLKGMTVKMVGSAPSNALTNVNLFVDGTKVGTAMINTNMQYVFDLGSAPYSMNTGAHQIEVRGDIVAGANRNFYLSLEKGADLMLTDSQVSGGTVSVTPTYPTSVGTISNLNAAIINIANGTLTVNQDTSFNNVTTLVGGATNVKMAAFKLTSYGEDVKVNTIAFTPSIALATPASPDSLINVGLYVNGGQVGSTQTAVDATTLTFSSLGSNLIVPAGQTVTVELRGDVVNGGNVSVTAGTVQFGLTIAIGNAQGVSSGQLNTSAYTGSGQSLSVSSVNAGFGQTAGTGAINTAPGQSEKKIGSFTVQAGSAEGITITNIAAGLALGTMTDLTQITNLKIKDGSTVLSTPVGTPGASNNFSVTLPVSVSTTKTLDVYADIGSSASGTFTPSMTITYRGETSNVTTTSGPISSSLVTAGTASIIAGGVTFNNGVSMTSQAVVGNTSNFAIGTFNVKANTAVAGAVIKDMTFAVSGISSITVNGKTASPVSGVATIFDAGIAVPASADGVNIPVTVTLVCAGLANNCAADSAITTTVTLTGFTYNNGSTVVTTLQAPALSVSVNPMFVYASKPTFSVGSNTNNAQALNLGQESKIGEVTVSADAKGQIKINTLAFSIASVGITTPTIGSVRLADGNTTIDTTGSPACSAFGTCTFSPVGGYAIAAGSSKTFSLFGVIGGTQTANTSVTSVSSSLVAGSLSWDDSMGGATAQTGANIYNFPTSSWTTKL